MSGPNEFTGMLDQFKSGNAVGLVQRVVVDISAAQLLAANTTPIPIIYAATDSAIVVLSVIEQYTFVAAAYDEVLGLYYSGPSGVKVIDLDSLQGVADTMLISAAPAVLTGELADFSRQTLFLTGAADPQAGDGSLRLIVLYTIQPL